MRDNIAVKEQHADILHTIVFVEDNPDDYVIARYELQKLKLRNPIHRVATFDALMAYLEKAHCNRHLEPASMPCVIVMDLRLPQTSGLNAQAALRSTLNFRHIPIIVISSPERLNALKSAVDLGADGYLVKPFNRTEFCKLALRLRLPLEFLDTVIADRQETTAQGSSVFATS
jgi:CheY-like chemotaxis protein